MCCPLFCLQVFRIVGFASLTYVSLEEQAVLYFIEKYVKFKQGEVWRQIKAEFEAEVRAAAV